MAAEDHSNIEKLEVDVEVQSNPHKLYRMFKHDVKEVPKHLPHLIESVEVLEGDGLNVGTVKLWKYKLEGTFFYSKTRLTVVDDQKNIITTSVIEGDLLKDYKCFEVTLIVTPKGGQRDGSVVRWIVEYEKATEDARIPAHYIENLVCLTKELDGCHPNHAHSHSVGADNVEKLEVEVEVQCDADKFYNLFKHDVKELPKHVPHLYQHVEVLEGDGINVGSVKLWKYKLAGHTPAYCKERMTVVDDEKRIITHSFFEGEHTKDYSFFDVSFTVSPKVGHCGWSVVKWHVEYVKAHDDAPLPTDYIDHHLWLTKDLCAQLQKAA